MCAQELALQQQIVPRGYSVLAAVEEEPETDASLYRYKVRLCPHLSFIFKAVALTLNTVQPTSTWCGDSLACSLLTANTWQDLSGICVHEGAGRALQEHHSVLSSEGVPSGF